MEVPLREPKTVMKLDRLGAMFPTRMSFMRTLLRNLSQKTGNYYKTDLGDR